MRKLANIQGRFMLISKHDLLADRENYQRDPKVVKKILKEGWDWPNAIWLLSRRVLSIIFYLVLGAAEYYALTHLGR